MFKYFCAKCTRKRLEMQKEVLVYVSICAQTFFFSLKAIDWWTDPFSLKICLSWLHRPLFSLLTGRENINILFFFSKNLWRFLFIMVLVLYSLEDKNYCCLSTNFLSRHRQDIPDFRLFTVTRCACDFDQTANIGICISSSGGHYHNWPLCWWHFWFFAALPPWWDPNRSIQLSWLSVRTLSCLCRITCSTKYWLCSPVILFV